jgi:hypothetical protein
VPQHVCLNSLYINGSSRNMKAHDALLIIYFYNIPM